MLCVGYMELKYPSWVTCCTWGKKHKLAAKSLAGAAAVEPVKRLGPTDHKLSIPRKLVFFLLKGHTIMTT